MSLRIVPTLLAGCVFGCASFVHSAAEAEAEAEKVHRCRFRRLLKWLKSMTKAKVTLVPRFSNEA